MKRSFSLLLALWAFLLLPAIGFADYSLTPVNVSELTVNQKLVDLGYLEQAKSASASTVEKAIHSFQKDQEIAETDELDVRTLVRLFSLADSSTAACWVPVYGGERYHSSDSCSNMNEPEHVPLLAALELGYTPCKRCKP